MISIRALLLFTTSLDVLQLTFAATTNGPLAKASVYSELAYSTARPCAAGCLVYNGIWVCGVNAGYQDLGKNIGCGCSPTNACFCSDGLKSSATSYLSSCIQSACSTLGNVDADVSSILGLYDGYCATANRAEDLPTKTTATSNAKTGAATAGTGLRASTASATSSVVDVEQKSGVGKTGTIALGAALGIGIPILLLLAGLLFLKLRDRKKTSTVAEPSPAFTNATTAYSNTPSTMMSPLPAEVPAHAKVELPANVQVVELPGNNAAYNTSQGYQQPYK